jgi:hypothetical protein
VGPGSFRADALDGFTLTGAFFQSSSEENSGGRYVLDPDGMHFTDAAAQLTNDFDVYSGLATLTGSLQTQVNDQVPRAILTTSNYEYTYPDTVNVNDTDHVVMNDEGINYYVRSTDTLPAFMGVQTRITTETDPDGNVVASLTDGSYLLIRSAKKTANGKTTEVLIEDDSITFVVNSASQVFEGDSNVAPTPSVRVASLRISATGVAITGNLTVTGTYPGA